MGCKRAQDARLKWALQGGARTPADGSYRETPGTPGILLEPAGVARASNPCCKPLVLQSLGWQMWHGIIRDHVPRAAGEQATPLSERQR